jgi:hypothetical protein
MKREVLKKWSGHISLKRDRDKKNTASEKE